jgi:hypothetical protein
MKAFATWDKKEYPLPPCYERGPLGRAALKERKAAWRAALEWALRQKVSRCIDDDMNPPDEIIFADDIEDELGEK